ncbi:hypothetical protein KDAU_37950 [Dictyobacter aurantiacus]|uniref:Uncharacterized protein n=1 Tax=Dictyobacter aurantiacus TaxID=1936993 RepID=A0A401ZHZ6_9CHLR|nr:hypothetical protein KDAU_37950 [Dictyobacter aurantiacus]
MRQQGFVGRRVKYPTPERKRVPAISGPEEKLHISPLPFGDILEELQKKGGVLPS